jgi:hypothetical protein
LNIHTFIVLCLPAYLMAQSQPAAKVESFAERTANVNKQFAEKYPIHGFNLSTNYFSRFSLDPDAKAGADETAIDPNWRIALAADASTVAQRMAKDLAEFLDARMGVKLAMSELMDAEKPALHSIILLESGGGDADAPDSFTIQIKPDSVVVRGQSAGGLRDGVVKLVDLIGFRHAPFFDGEKTFTARVCLSGLGVVRYKAPAAKPFSAATTRSLCTVQACLPFPLPMPYLSWWICVYPNHWLITSRARRMRTNMA